MGNAKTRGHRIFEGRDTVDNAPVVDRAFFGYTMENGKAKRLEGLFVEEERGHKEGSPCWAWQGSFIRGRPYLRTHRKSLSVLKLIAVHMGKRGHVYQRCKSRDCINPDHLASRHYWRHQKKDEKTGRFA